MSDVQRSLLVCRRRADWSCGSVVALFPQDPLFQGCRRFWLLGRAGSTEGTRKLESAVTRDEEQLMFASRLNVTPVIEVDGEHFSVKIAKPPMYPG